DWCSLQHTGPVHVLRRGAERLYRLSFSRRSRRVTAKSALVQGFTQANEMVDGILLHCRLGRPRRGTAQVILWHGLLSMGHLWRGARASRPFLRRWPLPCPIDAGAVGKGPRARQPALRTSARHMGWATKRRASARFQAALDLLQSQQ